ncbi:poly-beta-1,6-N-acetyl-D-glucosamine biosynthesis protein PgaD [Lysobacter sp. LF1]|uniref:Poly-beta-1,6-N-acetyl-D-glucosamine biosynthesis protein PgaD n=1 Tax=Lysobacter stagni TaxID=3045172 RepID=A0ABT6XIE7_9GAMM|nr:poly-beta-1,6-N-acetyl-D-glucosamine biosynthesis protein PgaD [Lysobacter sp. LF1]MDI9239925.1 poly-beta-1,6-N-acetyl-D-glucosamine biosynthesis protein PgaD [Lysobacter sp. LF1]
MRWPPLIEQADLPLWARIRDTALTVLVWGLLAWLLKDGLLVLFYALLDTVGIGHPPPPWTRGRLLRILVPFMTLVAFLMAWLVAFSIARWKLLTDTRDSSTQPGPLPLEEQEQAFGVPPASRIQLQQSRIVTVSVGTDMRELRVQERTPRDA